MTQNGQLTVCESRAFQETKNGLNRLKGLWSLSWSLLNLQKSFVRNITFWFPNVWFKMARWPLRIKGYQVNQEWFKSVQSCRRSCDPRKHKSKSGLFLWFVTKHFGFATYDSKWPSKFLWPKGFPTNQKWFKYVQPFWRNWTSQKWQVGILPSVLSSAVGQQQKVTFGKSRGRSSSTWMPDISSPDPLTLLTTVEILATLSPSLWM